MTAPLIWFLSSEVYMTRNVSQTYSTPNPTLFDGLLFGKVHFTPTRALVDGGTILPKVTATVEIESVEESGVDYLASFEVELAVTELFGGNWAYQVHEELWHEYLDGTTVRTTKVLDRQSVITVPLGAPVTLAELIEAAEEEESS